jgi:hypothetical protein
MSTRKITYIQCDGWDVSEGADPITNHTNCKSTFVDLEGPQDEVSVRKAAKRAGWRGRGFDYCPDHAWMKG